MITPYSNSTTDELLRLVFIGGSVDPLVLELAFRLEQTQGELERLQA